MRGLRYLIFLLLVGTTFSLSSGTVVGQFSGCTAGWSGCSNGTCANPSVTPPSCESLCRGPAPGCCSGSSEPLEPLGCGNPGAGNCTYNQVYIFKSCRCAGNCSPPPAPTCEASCGYGAACVCQACNGGAWSEWDQTCYNSSPILIDLQDNRYGDELTSASQGVWFDINATGNLIRTAWTKPESRVGFLVLDRNSNGVIDDGSELFGNSTRKSDGSLAANGFDALQDLDRNGDQKIDSDDAVYSRLRMWVDSNHNGYSEVQELFTL